MRKNTLLFQLHSGKGETMEIIKRSVVVRVRAEMNVWGTDNF